MMLSMKCAISVDTMYTGSIQVVILHMIISNSCISIT